MRLYSEGAEARDPRPIGDSEGPPAWPSACSRLAGGSSVSVPAFATSPIKVTETGCEVSTLTVTRGETMILSASSRAAAKVDGCLPATTTSPTSGTAMRPSLRTLPVTAKPSCSYTLMLIASPVPIVYSFEADPHSVRGRSRTR